MCVFIVWIIPKTSDLTIPPMVVARHYTLDSTASVVVSELVDQSRITAHLIVNPTVLNELPNSDSCCRNYYSQPRAELTTTAAEVIAVIELVWRPEAEGAAAAKAAVFDTRPIEHTTETWPRGCPAVRKMQLGTPSFFEPLVHFFDHTAIHRSIENFWELTFCSIIVPDLL